MDELIRDRLLEKARQLHEAETFGVTGLEDTAREGTSLVNDLENYPHAFVIGCVMDRQVKAERAWEIPERVRDRLGTFELKALAQLSETEVLKIFREPPALHRFPANMAENFRSAVHRIHDRYDGDASRIWAGPIGSATLVRRFLEFDGVGPKIATMAVNILVRDFRIELSDRHYIDISVDTHVKRVFGRLGLVPQGADNFEIIYAAREMNTDFPGIFDFPCWEIGRNWCRPGVPKCPECYMRDVCPSATRFYPEKR